jgi:MarR family transcriptional regulator, temperature-dependent positive regulator of motility
MNPDVNGDRLEAAMGTATTPGSLVLLTRLARAVFARTTEEVLGMRLKQYSVLSDLRDSGGALSQQSLCGAMHLDPNYVVLLLNEVEEAGYAERRRDPADRRRHIVELTPAGRRALERAEAGMQSVEDEVLSGLSQKQRVELGRLLSQALNAAEAEAGASVEKAEPAAAARR